MFQIILNIEYYETQYSYLNNVRIVKISDSYTKKFSKTVISNIPFIIGTKDLQKLSFKLLAKLWFF